MGTQCYALVRGSAIRVTALDERGAVTEPVRYGVSKAVAKVQINEVSEPATREILSNAEDEKRIRLHRSAKVIRYAVDIDFLRVDPSVFNLVAGAAVRHKSVSGFGSAPFGSMPFGGTVFGDETGFDMGSRTVPVGFALEVWSKLAGGCVENTGESSRPWGYTLFPYLRGGRITGFRVDSGLVSFRLVGARTRRLPRWGVGPYDLEGSYERLTEPVSRNTHWRTMILSAAPPVQFDGTREFVDLIDNGTPANPMPDPLAPLAVDGGGPADTSSYIIDGGRL